MTGTRNWQREVYREAQEADPRLHFHVMVFPEGGLYGDKLERRFDDWDDADAFARNRRNRREYGRMEVIECRRECRATVEGA